MPITEYVKEDWERSSFGGSSHIPQQVFWQSILDWQVKMFFYSCYLYYVKDDPKLNDQEFDNINALLERHYDSLPDRIKHVCGPGEIKATAHLFAYDLTEQEQKDALLWRNKEL